MLTLRREVESLLGQLSKADEFLQRPALEVAVALAFGPHALVVGQEVGPYQIHGRLGAGGMGEVYRAHDTKLGRDVAIKILPRVTSDRERSAASAAQSPPSMNPNTEASASNLYC
jgi:eukaryotic-like serine/threonine-protein kinase